MILSHKPHFEVFLIRGMEDLPNLFHDFIASRLDAVAFDSNWDERKETLEEKLQRFDRFIKKNSQGKEVIFVAISAGAALALTYILRSNVSVSHIFSASGLLNPNIHDFNLSHLTKVSDSFKEAAFYLTHHLTPEAIEIHSLPEKTTAFSSPEGIDSVVPFGCAMPDWVKEENKILIGNSKGAPDHLPAIALTLLNYLPKKLEEAIKK